MTTTVVATAALACSASADASPTISVDDQQVTETPGGVMATFAVTLSEPSLTSVSVDASTATGTAGIYDFNMRPVTTLTFAPGTTRRTINVLVGDDNRDEFDETFHLDLANVFGDATIAKTRGTATIVDNDATPTISSDDVNVAEPDTGFGFGYVTYTLSAPSEKSVSIEVATATGTAGSGDFNERPRTTVSFAPGTTSRTVNVAASGDLIDEPDELFYLDASNPAHASLVRTRSTITIGDNDAQPTITVSDVRVDEPDSGMVLASFTVSLSAQAGKPITVDVNTAANTAGIYDFNPRAPTTLTFDPGSVSRTVNVWIQGDLRDEYDERFFLTLSNATNADAFGRGTATIVDNDVPPSISVSDEAVTEPVGEYTLVTLALALSATSEKSVVVDTNTATGTAGNADFNPRATTPVTFVPGTTGRTINIAILGDTIDEDDERLYLDLSNPTDATIARGRAAIRIVDNDDPPRVSVEDGRYDEPDAVDELAPMRISLSNPSSKTVTVDTTTAAGTAGPLDYRDRPPTTVSFSPGQTSKTLNVFTRPDAVDEFDETALLTAANPTNSSLAQATGTLSILDDDAAPTFSVSDSAFDEPDSGDEAGRFNVALSAASEKPVSVSAVTSDGSALGDSLELVTGLPVAFRRDFAPQQTPLSFTPGETTKSVDVAVHSDALDEDDEQYHLDLTSAVNGTVGGARGTGTILDDDPMPSITVADVSVDEPTATGQAARFTLSLSAASGRPVTVVAGTTPGSAGSGDFAELTPATVTFEPGETTTTVDVGVTPDTLDEDDETFTLGLTNAQGATLQRASATATIADDDQPPSISVADLSVNEPTGQDGAATFTVSLSAASSKPVTVRAATAAGTAGSGDFDALSPATVTFAPGDTSKSVTVVTHPDSVDEFDETVFLDLSDATNASISRSRATVTIVDDDAAPGLSVADASLNEPDGDPESLAFTVSLSAASEKPISVAAATAASTATAADFDQTGPVMVNFAAGETTKQVTVPVRSDVADEDEEAFFLDLSNAVNAGVTRGRATGTIVDDDAAPTLSVSDVQVDEPVGVNGAASFDVTLSAASGRTVAVDVASADGSATAGPQGAGDYIGRATSTVTFTPGQTTRQVSVLVQPDALDEFDETFALNLSGPANATIADSIGTATIVDDDAAPTVSVGALNVVEPASGQTVVSAPVTLSAPSGKPVTVTYATADGSAQAGSDFTGIVGRSVVIPAGSTSVTTNVAILADNSREPAESFQQQITAPVNATLGTASATVTIGANCFNNEPSTFGTAMDLGSVSGDTDPGGESEAVTSPAGSSICGGETDWFKVRLREDLATTEYLSAAVDLEVADGAPNGDLDLFVYYSDGFEWDRSQNFGTTDEFSLFTTPDTSADDSDYIYIAVVGDPASATNDYTLTVTGNQ